MKRFLLFIITFMALNANAQRITEENAKEIALQFVNGHKGSSTKKFSKADKSLLHSVKLSLNKSQVCPVFAFNIGNNDGFVLISTDERTVPVLGYSDSGTLDADNLPDGLTFLLQDYADQLEEMGIEENSSAPVVNPRSAAKYQNTPISPMITCQWDQTGPYNLLCPAIDAKATYTGCVATAFAQLLYYHRPASCTSLGSYDYKYNSQPRTVPALPSTTFNWDIMKDQYPKSDTDDSAMEVAKLMRYCGQSVSMAYGTGSSIATTSKILTALPYFGMSANSYQEYRSSYLSNDWDNLIYNDLAKGLPVIISGKNGTAGHAFLCDGFDGDGLFHINWGWSGSSNGYFLLSALNPSSQGSGGSNDGYSSSIYALLNIHDSEPGEQPLWRGMEITDVATNNSSVNRYSSDSNFKFSLSSSIYSANTFVADIEQGWAVFDEQGNMLQVSPGDNFYELKPKYGWKTYTQDVSLGATLPSGRYYVKHVNREAFYGNPWQQSVSAGQNYVVMDISGNKAYLTASTGFGNYDIKDITVSPKMYSGLDGEVTLFVENNTLQNTNYVDIMIDDVLSKRIAINIDPGESATLRGTFASKNAGTHTLSINSAEGQVLYSTTFTDEPLPVYYFSVNTTYSPKPSYDQILEGNTITLNANYTNNTEYAYDYYLRFNLYEQVGSTAYLVETVRQPFYCAPSSKASASYTYNNLVNGGKYYISVAYYSTYRDDPSKKVWYVSTMPIFTCHANTTTIAPIITGTCASDEIYTLDGRRVNTMAGKGIYIRNGKKVIR